MEQKIVYFKSIDGSQVLSGVVVDQEDICGYIMYEVKVPSGISVFKLANLCVEEEDRELMERMVAADNDRGRCQGHVRRGEAFTLGPVVWEQCKSDSEVAVNVTQDGEEELMDACSACLKACKDFGIKINSIDLIDPIIPVMNRKEFENLISDYTRFYNLYMDTLASISGPIPDDHSEDSIISHVSNAKNFGDAHRLLIEFIKSNFVYRADTFKFDGTTWRVNHQTGEITPGHRHVDLDAYFDKLEAADE